MGDVTPILRDGEAVRQAIVAYIPEYTDAEGCSPSIEDIMDAVNRSRSTVHSHLEILKRQGRVTWKTNHPRTVRVVTPEEGR